MNVGSSMEASILTHGLWCFLSRSSPRRWSWIICSSCWCAFPHCMKYFTCIDKVLKFNHTLQSWYSHSRTTLPKRKTKWPLWIKDDNRNYRKCIDDWNRVYSLSKRVSGTTRQNKNRDKIHTHPVFQPEDRNLLPAFALSAWLILSIWMPTFAHTGTSCLLPEILFSTCKLCSA